MVLIDCVSRFILACWAARRARRTSRTPATGLLEYPQYTRPAEFRGMRVPEVLLSGHHANIQAWRREASLEKTRQMRPELLGTHGRTRLKQPVFWAKFRVAIGATLWYNRVCDNGRSTVRDRI